MNLQPPHGDESNQELVDLVAGEILRHGPITFARFMEIVINHPDYGYYASSTDRAGRSGDFLTAPETHFVFGWLVARQIHEFWERMGRRPQLAVAEYGAGRGTLGLQILDWFSRHPPEGLESLNYQIVDLNPAHQAKIERLIEENADASPLSLASAGSGSRSVVVLANELLDAMPFHRLIIENGDVRELYVALEDGWFTERAEDISQEASGVFDLQVPVTEGQVFEYSPAIGRWLIEVSERLDEGYIAIFDYGDEREALLDHDRFPKGTLKTYRRHEVGEDPFRDLGQRDITAHVDFTYVADVARQSGLHVVGVTSQAEFVAGAGLDQVLLELQELPDAASEYPPARAAAMELLNPGGLGRFRVAILTKNIEDQDPLMGLAFRIPGITRR